MAAHKKTPVLQGSAAGCEVVQSGRVEDRGLEPGACPCGNNVVSGICAAGSVENRPIDLDLARVIETWWTLPVATRMAMLSAAQ